MNLIDIFIKRSKLVFYSVLLLLLITIDVSAQESQNDTITLKVENVVDKIRGGLLGEILGNLNGLPHEMKYIKEPGNVKNYVPSLPEGAWTDDDTDFEWVYICEMQKQRDVFLQPTQICSLWEERINKRIWCSNRFARYLMDIGIEPPLTGKSIFNPWASFNISGQFLCETFALIAPGMPQTASKIGLNYTTVTINNEPAQTTQLFSTMIAQAFVTDNINDIIDFGVAAIDENSELNGIINDVKSWYSEYPNNWRKTRQLLHEKYTQEDNNIRDFNGHELNTGAIIAALLYGNGDFSESLKLAFNFGWDADCNAATVGTILGVIHGYRNMISRNSHAHQDWMIVDRYKNITRDNMPMNETITSYADRIIELFEMVNSINGGEKVLDNNRMVYKIIPEHPTPVVELADLEKQKQIIKIELEEQIKKDLQSTDRKSRARAAYYAVCLDMDKSIKSKYPDKWEQASYDLSGYWKLMSSVFFFRYTEFNDFRQFRQKFIEAGFKGPKKEYEDDELYNDMEIWKEPERLY
ncbi:hypothetical protein GM418_27160 [Maribellus comscasis]|uniref:ADP-ribosylglycohydrolase family protein n=1 Tax=Maribellus comscasis TaxID=2681766 RepID=A0A6I6K182_9BACT|nr:ADP-ribosylglycohydrolase family protein [Maribellus comscasis]QGY47210.1 hypothetical protein GM418_27160 [Maribellus comscasis]